MSEHDAYRLPRTVLPRRYDLHLVPDLDAATFAGTVSIEVEVVETVTEIVLNSIELTIDETTVERDGERHPATVALDDDTERATLTLDAPLGPGPATVHLTFAGVLNDKLHGFYRSTFTDDHGRSRTIATTQFEATDARRAFPCWDEPDMKAVFAVAIDVPRGLFAVSNAAEAATEDLPDGTRRVRFADTMVMSTYLLAFVVGPLTATDPVDVDGVELRVVHRPGQEHLTAFALESGAFALRHFTEYFGVDYPADKLDLIAVPDFAFGAMENLGCVTFREALLLVDPDRATQPELQRVADVIHHEIAHMWFGDLVTMSWWEGIWLNEAFATFMEMRCTDAFRPEWDRWTDFGISRTAAYDTDALRSTRPIEFEVVSPADAEGMFDILTYEKGAAVVRMLEQYLGEDRFRDGIRLYISRHAYGNTRTTDLWDAIEEATGEPVRRIMDSWIYQGGHPEVSVERVADDRLRLGQQRFLYRTDDDTPDDTTWAVPVLLRIGTDPTSDPTDGGSAASAERVERVLLEGPGTDVALDAGSTWVLANSGGSGFFRVRYDAAGRAALGRATGLAPIERYGLVDDAWASLVAGTSRVGDLLALLRTYADEQDLSVWQRVIGVLGSLGRLLDDEARPDVEAFVRALVGPALLRTGLAPGDDESARTTARRGALFAAMGTLGRDPEIAEHAARLLERADADPDAVDADLLDAAVRVAAAHGDAERFADFRRRAADPGATPQERLRYQGALADFPGADEVDVFLAMTVTDEVRSQDAPFVLRRALGSRDHTGRVWEFMARSWDDLLDCFPSRGIDRMLEGIRTVTDPATAAAIDGFLAEHPVPQAGPTLDQHRERMRAGVLLREAEGAALALALSR
ncbi:MAG: M1 family peptidase [Acidimicrobiales bacterium]|nr:M1 family peptidase [Acidimicrobiales bacterium]